MNTKIEVLHKDHREWLNKIDFYYDDLKIFRHRLEEVVSHNTSHEVLSRTEHFQNQFIIQKNELDELRHLIHEAEGLIVDAVEKNSIAINRQAIPDDGTLRDRMSHFEKLFHDLRIELMSFLSRSL